MSMGEYIKPLCNFICAEIFPWKGNIHDFWWHKVIYVVYFLHTCKQKLTVGICLYCLQCSLQSQDILQYILLRILENCRYYMGVMQSTFYFSINLHSDYFICTFSKTTVWNTCSISFNIYGLTFGHFIRKLLLVKRERRRKRGAAMRYIQSGTANIESYNHVT